MNPEISIIVPVFNGQKTLGKCLQSLFDMKSDWLFEIIVINNGSTDQTEKIAKSYAVKYFFEPQKGRPYARNKGLQKARGKFIAFIDADCYVKPNWLKEMMKGFLQPSIGACGGCILGAPTTNSISNYLGRDEQEHSKAIQGDINRLPALYTCNAIFRSEVFKNIGCFDEQLATCEDVDLSWRMHYAGFKLQYVSNAVVEIQCPDSISKMNAKFFERGHMYAYLIYKHYARDSRIKFAQTFHWKELSEKLMSGLGKPFSRQRNKRGAMWSIYKLFKQGSWLLGYLWGIFLIKLGFVKLRTVDWSSNTMQTRLVDNQMVCSNPGEEESMILDEIGTRMMEMLNKKYSRSKIIQELTQEYHADPEVIGHDLDEFKETLREHKILA